jgi:hypothetical protein
MKREFHFEFDDESSNRSLTYEAGVDERLAMTAPKGVATLCGSPGGFLVLARILIQMALSDYSNGFHVHLQQDYDPDKHDCLTIMLDRSE